MTKTQQQQDTNTTAYSVVKKATKDTTATGTSTKNRSIQLDPDTAMKLSVYCVVTGKSQSKYVNELVKKALKDFEVPKLP